MARNKLLDGVSNDVLTNEFILEDDLTFTSSNIGNIDFPRTINGAGAIFNGNNKTITLDNIQNFNGLLDLQWGTIKDLTILVGVGSTTAVGAGWLCQRGAISNNRSSGVDGYVTSNIDNCHIKAANDNVETSSCMIGDNVVSNNSIKSFAFHIKNCTAICKLIGKNALSDNNILTLLSKITNCQAYGIIDASSACRNAYSTINFEINDCCSLGTIVGSLAMFGNSNQTGITYKINNCESSGALGSREGGIVGTDVIRSNANCRIAIEITKCNSSCYTNGEKQLCGGIIGGYTISENSALDNTFTYKVIINECNSSGLIFGDGAYGIVGGQSSNVTVTNCIYKTRGPVGPYGPSNNYEDNLNDTNFTFPSKCSFSPTSDNNEAAGITSDPPSATSDIDFFLNKIMLGDGETYSLDSDLVFAYPDNYNRAVQINGKGAIFDGNNHTIRLGSTTNFTSIFDLENGTIKNLLIVVENDSTTSDGDGWLCQKYAASYNTTGKTNCVIENCHIEGANNSSMVGDYPVSYNYAYVNFKIINCSAEGRLVGKYAASYNGKNNNNGVIDNNKNNSVASNNKNNSAASNNRNNCGKCGKPNNRTNIYFTVVDSYSTGQINNSGGIVDNNAANNNEKCTNVIFKIIKCFSLGQINNSGGIVGEYTANNNKTASNIIFEIDNCLSFGSLSMINAFGILGNGSINTTVKNSTFNSDDRLKVGPQNGRNNYLNDKAIPNLSLTRIICIK